MSNHTNIRVPSIAEFQQALAGAGGPGAAVQAATTGLFQGAELGEQFRQRRVTEQQAAQQFEERKRQFQENLRLAQEEARAGRLTAPEFETGKPAPGRAPFTPSVAGVFEARQAALTPTPPTKLKFDKLVEAVNPATLENRLIGLNVGESLPSGFRAVKEFKTSTEAQGKASGFANRAILADENMVALVDKGLIVTKKSQLLLLRNQLSKLEDRPGIVQAFISSITDPELQSFFNSALLFTTALTRSDSGAAISPPEYMNTLNTFVEMPGDSDQLQQQKRFQRQSTSNNLATQANVGLLRPLINPDKIRKEARTLSDRLFPPVLKRKVTEADREAARRELNKRRIKKGLPPLIQLGEQTVEGQLTQ